MKVGYVRVSTIEQNEERQIVELRKNVLKNFSSIKFLLNLLNVRNLTR